jgi:hypothetical protein
MTTNNGESSNLIAVSTPSDEGFTFFLRNFLHWCEAGVLCLAGLLGIVVALGHKVGFLKFFEGRELHLSLGIMSLLAVALGLERFTRFSRIEKQFDAIDRTLTKTKQSLLGEISHALPARLLTGIEVFEQAAGLVGVARHSIKALVYEGETDNSATISEAIAHHLENHSTIKFELVLAVNLESITEDFWRIHEQRFDAYKRRHVEKQVDRFLLDTRKAFGFDTLIVDNTHVGLAFSPVPAGEQTKQVGIRFWSQQTLASELTTWFDHLTRTGGPAKRYEDVKSERRATAHMMSNKVSNPKA